MPTEPIIYVADAGSVATGRYHWVSSHNLDEAFSDPAALATSIATDLERGDKVALGYESPLFIPVEEDPSLLGKARQGECTKETGNRPFNAGAGASVLATGLQSLAWVLLEIHRQLPTATATTRWDDFRQGNYQLFVWEAFVSGSEKADPPCHAGDARLAIAAFRQVMDSQDSPTRVTTTQTLSLAGAAILSAGLSRDLGILSEPCLVLRPIDSRKKSSGECENHMEGPGYGG